MSQWAIRERKIPELTLVSFVLKEQSLDHPGAHGAGTGAETADSALEAAELDSRAKSLRLLAPSLVALGHALNFFMPYVKRKALEELCKAVESWKDS